MKKLDSTQAALLGISADRRNQIKDPSPLKCEGCGVTVYCSKDCIEPARAVAKKEGHRLYTVCRKCAEPFMNRIAVEGGKCSVPDGTKTSDLDGVMDSIKQKRRRFLESN